MPTSGLVPISLWKPGPASTMHLTRCKGSCLDCASKQAAIRPELMREIVLDTETTGMEQAEGPRLVEIGALELIRHIPTGRVFHVYLNPERPMPPDAYAVHGLSDDFLRTQPRFATIAEAFEEFIGDAPL